MTLRSHATAADSIFAIGRVLLARLFAAGRMAVASGFVRGRHRKPATSGNFAPAMVAMLSCVCVPSLGCRNATQSPITPLGASSPLLPMQTGPSLSPIQPTSGVSTFGSPTRVPPPATGSYNAFNGFGNPISPNNYSPPSYSQPPYSQPAGANSYGPAGFQGTSGFQSSRFQPSTSSIGNASSNGALLSASGMTRGLTNLMPNTGFPTTEPVNTGVEFPPHRFPNTAVQQTGWVSSSSDPSARRGQSQKSQMQPGNSASPGQSFSDPRSNASPRSGGMQVIDLVDAPYPPGYVPPQMRPGVSTNRFPSADGSTTNPQPVGDPPASTRQATRQATQLDWRSPTPRF